MLENQLTKNYSQLTHNKSDTFCLCKTSADFFFIVVVAFLLMSIYILMYAEALFLKFLKCK